MYNNSSAPSNNTALWHYLGTKHLDFSRENNGTPGVYNMRKYGTVHIMPKIVFHLCQLTSLRSFDLGILLSLVVIT